jgi:hypothetical protein
MRPARRIVVASLFASVIAQSSTASAEHQVWLEQFGTRSNDEAFHLATDADGTSYVVGRTFGELDGFTSAGASDAFVVVYQPDGTLASTFQFGTSGEDVATGVATDPRGPVYVVGGVEGAIPGNVYRGSSDAFVQKRRPNGTAVWTKQFGTPGYDIATAVAVHGRSVYVASLWDGGGSGVLRRHSSSGAVIWTSRIRAGWHLPVAADRSGVYVAGAYRTESSTAEDLDLDVLLRAYDHDGTVGWTRRFGTAEFEQPLGLAVRRRVVYLSGHTAGSLTGSNEGLSDAFVRTYDAHGTRIWTRQWGTAESDWAWDVEVDASADAYTVGFLGLDAFVTKLDPDGVELWTNLLSTGAGEDARGVSLAGRIVSVAGSTAGRLDGSTGPPTGVDGFVATFGTD